MRGGLRRIAVAGVLVLTAGSCAQELSPGTPECIDDFGERIGAVMMLQLQAVPDARWGACIEELKVGWEYEPQEAELGLARFWLSSDRMGTQFVEVALRESCDMSGAVPTRQPWPELERFVRVLEQPGPIQIAIIPVAPRHAGYVASVLAELDGVTLEGRPIAPLVPVSNAPAAVQIEQALGNGQIVLVADDREEASQTIELRRPGKGAEVGIDLEDALEEIEDDLGQPRYRAEWFHVFEGGCIVYRIDAKGAGAESVVQDLDEVLQFFPLREFREAVRAQGLDV